MTFKQVMATLFDTAEGTYYKWKKEKRPIISLLEKYFTKEDLEEFIEYGMVEKLEFANLQDYGNRVAEFVKLLYKLQDFLYQDYINATHVSYLEKKNDIPNIEALDRSLDLHMHVSDNITEITQVENEGLSYLALVFATDPLKSSENSEDFTVDNLSKAILHSYDYFQRLQTKNQKSVNWINSILLGDFLDAFRKEYPKYADYNQMLFRMAKNDFLSFVKLCSKYQPEYLNAAVRFCIQFNLYKHTKKSDTEKLYNQIIDAIGDITQDSFDFEKFKNEIKKITKK